MARKKIEPIVNLGNKDKLTVQKSLPLFALWRSELTLAEFKILDTYLSRIDSHNPDKRAVVFEKGELEKILGVQKINNKDLKSRLKNLMGNVIEIPDNEAKKGFRLVTLFEEAVAEQDDNGLWQVKLECTQKAMKYFFNIENLGYLRYKLRCITSITSRYTYIMFIYLEANRFRKSWEVSLEEVKQILDCDKEELYKEFKYFNRDVLKKVQKEMHEKTECKYTYEPIKKGRKVVAIKFDLKTLTDSIMSEKGSVSLAPAKDQTELDELDGLDSSYDSEIKDMLCILKYNCDNTFTVTELASLLPIVGQIPTDLLPSDCDYNFGTGDDLRSIIWRRHRFLYSEYLYFKAIKTGRIGKKNEIKNDFQYFYSMVKKNVDVYLKDRPYTERR